jgi:DNA polymerase-3 subunit beta
MKLTIERAALLKSLGHVQSVVERRNTIPILSNVLVEAKGDRVSLTATDMDLAIVEHTAAEVGAPGAATVPAHMLYDIVRKLPEGAQVQLELASDGGQVAMYLAKQLTTRSLPEIGRKFGGRDHTTVMHAVKKVEELRSLDASFGDDVELLRRML